jgi:hypothetical protein
MIEVQIVISRFQLKKRPFDEMRFDGVNEKFE